MTTLSHYRRPARGEMSSNRAGEDEKHPTITLSVTTEKHRRKYQNDDLYLNSIPTTAVERIRQDRLTRGLSVVALAEMVHLAPSAVKYHEERHTSDDTISTDYLKKVAVGLGLPEDYYLDDYLKWGDSKQYMVDVEHYIKQSDSSLEELYDILGAQEYAVMSWRKGRRRPPKRLFALFTQRGDGAVT